VLFQSGKQMLLFLGMMATVGERLEKVGEPLNRSGLHGLSLCQLTAVVFQDCECP
jgi:hypothetical protein